MGQYIEIIVTYRWYWYYRYHTVLMFLIAVFWRHTVCVTNEVSVIVHRLKIQKYWQYYRYWQYFKSKNIDIVSILLKLLLTVTRPLWHNIVDGNDWSYCAKLWWWVGDNFDICAICLEDCKVGDKLRILHCSHGQSVYYQCTSLIDVTFHICHL